ncbi:hypothetical protein YC2023_068326 [Brassica napus]
MEGTWPVFNLLPLCRLHDPLKELAYPSYCMYQVVRVIVIQKTLIEHAEKLRQVKAVLEEQRTFWNDAGGNFSGIYRKVQLKPLKWDGEGKE